MLFLVIAPLSFGHWDRSSIVNNLAFIPWTLAYGIWIVPIALIVGIVPGGVTGLVYALLRSRTSLAVLPAWGKLTTMAFVGAAACVLFGVCLGAAISDMVSREILGMFVFPGAVAAAVCTALAERTPRRAVQE